jgi:hypothetical protein
MYERLVEGLAEHCGVELDGAGSTQAGSGELGHR